MGLVGAHLVQVAEGIRYVKVIRFQGKSWDQDKDISWLQEYELIPWKFWVFQTIVILFIYTYIQNIYI